tara:strand:+ start:533 stop:997 length:465 start_codon:yes stop_codon:yes gene_type:complete
MEGIKHLIQCHCILPQYKNRKDPVFHKFLVFSIVGDDDAVIEKISQCNNCGVLHKVIDLCKSDVIRGKEESVSLIEKKDLKFSLPKDLISVLESYDCDLPTWEYVKFVFDQKAWNTSIVLSKEDIDDVAHIKLLTILSENRINIETKTRRETIL